MLHKLLWAKSDPYHPLWCHLLDVAAVCNVLLPGFWPDAPLSGPWICYLCALHDIGKADPFFQAKDNQRSVALKEAGLLNIDEHRVKPFRHESRSEKWLEQHLVKDCDWDKSSAKTVAKSIRAHHARFSFPEPNQFIHVMEALPELWEPMRAELGQLVHTVLAPEPFVPMMPLNHSVDGIRLAGLLVLSDWIASNSDTYDYVQLGQTADIDNASTYYEVACAEAAKQVARLGLNVTAPSFGGDVPLLFSQVWPKITSLRPSQKALQSFIQYRIPPGLAIIEAPMGEGKTEMAIYLTEEWRRQIGQRGTYIALPTQATSNQLHRRYSDYLSKRDQTTLPPRLIHGMAWLREDDTPELPPDTEASAEALEWFASAKRALIAPEGVGTVDQALLAALFVRHGFLRLFGLAQKILIVDEVHAYDEHMTTILCRLLVWCHALRIPIILLSATLSRRQKARLLNAYADQPLPLDSSYPLLTFAPWEGLASSKPVLEANNFSRKIVLCQHDGLLGNSEQVAALAKDIAAENGCICVLVNTVSMAQKVYERLEEYKSAGALDAKLLLFHARFRAEAREDIEKRVVKKFGPHPVDKSLLNPKRPSKSILVCTQVVENSLDVCFDVLLSELAPIDLLLQRSGRMHRHFVNPRYGHVQPVLHLFMPEKDKLVFGATEFDGRSGVYEREALLRTLAVLQGQSEIHLPTDFRTLIEQVYGDEPLPAEHTVPAEELASAAEARLKREQKAEEKAREHLIAEPSNKVFAYDPAAPAVDEAEEGTGTGDYFHAQTRTGDDSIACLLLSSPELAQEMNKSLNTAAAKAAQGDTRWTPSRDLMRSFFRQKINLPAYFPLPPKLERSPRWLRHHRVIIAPGGIWQSEEGTILKDSAILGVTKE